ncbi:MAG TPA: hypothetical protein VG253_11680, partial [Streptosporangiaceae bacterium]|nr:hypothetical protein [Streptosporangiaceae bacterium]
MSQDRPSHDLATSGVSSNQAPTGAAEQTSPLSGTPSSEGQEKSSEGQAKLSESQGMPSAARQIPLPGHVTLPAEVQREHDAAVAEIRRAYQAIPPGARIRLAKRTSNL